MKPFQHRYLIFGGTTYYPDGGVRDFQRGFDSLDDIALYVKVYYENSDPLDGLWLQVYDVEENTMTEYRDGELYQDPTLLAYKDI